MKELNMENKNLLGIIGGLGPMSSAYFYELITTHTLAQKDQEHIDIILSSRASTPDRTDYILGLSDKNPLDYMIADAKALEKYGATAIVIPCNTAHYFIKQVRASVNVPVPSIITETALQIKKCNFKKPAILATEGTIKSKSYQNEFDSLGLDYMVPDAETQSELMHMIYGQVKKGYIPSPSSLYKVTEGMFRQGCDCAILGCTELSLIGKNIENNMVFIDSLTVLAKVSIEIMGHQTTNLPTYLI